MHDERVFKDNTEYLNMLIENVDAKVEIHTEALSRITQVFNAMIDDQNEINKQINARITKLIVLLVIQAVPLVGMLLYLVK